MPMQPWEWNTVHKLLFALIVVLFVAFAYFEWRDHTWEKVVQRVANENHELFCSFHGGPNCAHPLVPPPPGPF